MKATAYNKIKVTQKLKFVKKRIENIVGKSGLYGKKVKFYPIEKRGNIHHFSFLCSLLLPPVVLVISAVFVQLVVGLDAVVGVVVVAVNVLFL